MSVFLLLFLCMENIHNELEKKPCSPDSVHKERIVVVISSILYFGIIKFIKSKRENTVILALF